MWCVLPTLQVAPRSEVLPEVLKSMMLMLRNKVRINNPTRSNPQSAAGAAGTQAVMTVVYCPPCVPTPIDTVPVLAMCAQGALREGWRDASHGSDLHSFKWRCARQVKPIAG
jgi:hypothetical protein